ncbi:hypothetical protein AGMMS50229_12470 [Campylobacterota bacterium]|nr:hypothetical protein AGMMS50229_12470 [Campylobacterota bacterium]
MKAYISKIIEYGKKHKKYVAAALFLICFILFLIAMSPGGKKPFKYEDAAGNTTEPPSVLETSFDRWYRGEKGELLASFYLINHTDREINNLHIACAAYTAMDIETAQYEQRLSVVLQPTEVRHLHKIFIGELDPLATKAVCRIDEWE